MANKFVSLLVLFSFFGFQSFASTFGTQSFATTHFDRPLADTTGKMADSIVLGAFPRPARWIDKPTSFQINSPASITVTSKKESDLFVFVDGQYYINSATKLLFAPDSDFIFTAKIKPGFNSMYDGGAIMLYSDSSNWASFLFEMNEKSNWAVSSSVVANRISDGNYYSVTSCPQIYLKIVKSGKIFCFYHSTDGRTWTLTRTFPYTATAGMLLGFYAQSPKGEGCTVEFSEISYRAKKFTDFFSGE